jgi:hypothetical protein
MLSAWRQYMQTLAAGQVQAQLASQQCNMCAYITGIQPVGRMPRPVAQHHKTPDIHRYSLDAA